MPIALDTEETIWFPLASDAKKPDETRPEFETRFLDYATVRKIRRAIESAVKETDDEKANELLDDALCSALVGWRNMGQGEKAVTFSREALSHVLTVNEKYELASLCVIKTQLAELDRKKSGWQSLLNAEASAETATGLKESA